MKKNTTNITPVENLEVQGARVHNLKNIDLSIPREKLVVFTGLSGSGKSSLAFDTIYAEGQRRYIETFSAYARQFLGGLERPDVDKIDGLSPVIARKQPLNRHALQWVPLPRYTTSCAYSLRGLPMLIAIPQAKKW